MTEPRVTQKLDPAEIRHVVDHLDDRLVQLEVAVVEAATIDAPETPTVHFETLVENARLDWDLLSRTAMDALRSADIAAREQIASEQATSHVDQIGRQLDVELNTIAAELHAHHCDDGSAADAWRAVGESWRGRADELRVQANLARRELREQAHVNVDRVEGAVESLRSSIDDVRERAADASPELRRPFGALIDTARSAARETGRWLIDHAGADEDGEGDDSGSTP